MRVILLFIATFLLSFTLAAQPSLVVSESSLQFHGSAQKKLLVASNGAPLSFRSQTGYWGSGSGWLSVTGDSGLTPSPIIVSVDSSQLARGVYYGYVQLNSDAGQSAMIHVTLDVGRSSTDHAGTLRAREVFANGSDPLTIAMTAAPHGSPQTQTVQLTTTYQGDPYSAIIRSDLSVPADTSWLTITPATGTMPASVTITADPTNLGIGNYQGVIEIDGNHGDFTGVTVNFNVTSASTAPTITASPTSLNFSYTLGGSAPAAQQIQLSASSPASFTVSVPSDATWLSVDSLSGSTPKTLNLSINTTGLAAGTRSTTLTITGGGGSPISIPVQLSVTSNAANGFSVSQSSVALTQVLGSAAASQSVTLSSNSAANFTITVPSGATWLSVSPTSGTTPATLVFTVNTSGLAAGNQSTTVAVNKGQANELDINVALTATSTTGAITPTPVTVTFSQTAGGTAAASQSIRLDASTSTSFTASSSASWLTISPSSGTTPANLILSVSSSGLSPGRYTTSIAVLTGSTTAATIPVTFVISAVSSGGTIFAIPSTIAFSHTIGGNGYHLQFVHIDANGPTSFTATPGVSWLTVSPASGTTPTDVVVTANATGMTAGAYQGTIEIDGGAAPTIVTVQLTVSAAANAMTAAPATVAFTQNVGSTTAAAQTVQLSSTNPVNFNASSSAGWFIVSPMSGTTPATLTVTPTPGGLQPGNYSDTITVTGGLGALAIPVTLTLSATTAAITPAPTSLTFAQTIGAGAPAPQTVQLSATTAANFTAATPTPWLTVSPSSGTTPATLAVSANGAGLSAGTYQGSVAVLGGGNPTLIPVTFTVSNPIPVVNAILSPATLSFNATNVGPAPASQSVSVSSSGAQFGFTATASTTDGATWLTVTPSSATSPATLAIGVATAGLKGGQYSGAITVTPTNASIAPQTIAVSLNMAIAPAVRLVANSASLVPGTISPGELITISGTNLGPTPGVGANILGAAAVDTVLAATRVLFDGIAAPLLFVSANQINAVVPYGVAGMASSNMQVEYGGVRSNPIDLGVANTAPGIFTTSSNGMGQAAAVNEDGSANGAIAAAPRGSIVSIFGTGEGQTKPAGQDGAIMSNNVAVPVAPVVVKIAGSPADVLYAGSAPGQVAGNLQINVRVPSNITIGAQLPLEVDIGGVASQFGVTIAVK